MFNAVCNAMDSIIREITNLKECDQINIELLNKLMIQFLKEYREKVIRNISMNRVRAQNSQKNKLIFQPLFLLKLQSIPLGYQSVRVWVLII